MQTANLTKTELRLVKERNERIFFNSRFSFILQHNGFRPGSIHTFIGVSGGGKSTLVRSLIIDLLKFLDDEKRALIWLSEESYIDFVTELSNSEFAKDERLQNLFVKSEQDFDFKNSDEALLEFKKSCEDVDLVFLDNITTSDMYQDKPVSQQAVISKKIKKIAEARNLPIVIIAHTGGLITENIPRLIDQNDIRGGKSLVNISQFFYVLQRLTVGERIFPTLRITKYRSQKVGHKLFSLKFCPEQKIYRQDVELSFHEFKEAFKQRNLL